MHGSGLELEDDFVYEDEIAEGDLVQLDEDSNRLSVMFPNGVIPMDSLPIVPAPMDSLSVAEIPTAFPTSFVVGEAGARGRGHIRSRRAQGRGRGRSGQARGRGRVRRDQTRRGRRQEQQGPSARVQDRAAGSSSSDAHCRAS